MKIPTNIRAKESQDRIATSLLFLLEKEKFQAITITQIVQEAELSRKTFYRNFSEKEDVIKYILEKIFLDFDCNIKELAKFSNAGITHCYFDTWYQNRQVLKTMKKNNLMSFVYALHVLKLRKLYNKYATISCSERNVYQDSIIIGTYFSMLEQWLDDGFALSPIDIANLYSAIISNLGQRI